MLATSFGIPLILTFLSGRRTATCITALATSVIIITGSIYSLSMNTEPDSEAFTDEISEIIAEAGDLDSVTTENQGKDLLDSIKESDNKVYLPLNMKVEVDGQERFITLGLEPVNNNEDEYKFKTHLINASGENLDFTAENILSSSKKEPAVIKN